MSKSYRARCSLMAGLCFHPNARRPRQTISSAVYRVNSASVQAFFFWQRTFLVRLRAPLGTCACRSATQRLQQTPSPDVPSSLAPPRQELCHAQVPSWRWWGRQRNKDENACIHNCTCMSAARACQHKCECNTSAFKNSIAWIRGKCIETNKTIEFTYHQIQLSDKYSQETALLGSEENVSKPTTL